MSGTLSGLVESPSATQPCAAGAEPRLESPSSCGRTAALRQHQAAIGETEPHRRGIHSRPTQQLDEDVQALPVHLGVPRLGHRVANSAYRIQNVVVLVTGQRDVVEGSPPWNGFDADDRVDGNLSLLVQLVE